MQTAMLPTSRTLQTAKPAPRTVIRVPESPAPFIQLHTSRERFESHLERHLASDEAIRAVAFAHPDLFGPAADADCARSPRDIVRALRRADHHPDFRNLEERYAKLATRTLVEAREVGWLVQPNPRVMVAFSPSGLLAVVDGGILRTLFFPGLQPDAVRLEEAGYFGAEFHAQVRREASWDATTRHYYAVMRPAIQLIRSLPIDAIAGTTSQYGALKRVLPTGSVLRLQEWATTLMRVTANRARLEEARGVLANSDNERRPV